VKNKKIQFVFVIVFLSLFLIPNFSQFAIGAHDNKITLCHFPPGNPENFQTLSVGPPAVRSHLDHGDVLGDCETLPTVTLVKVVNGGQLTVDDFGLFIDGFADIPSGTTVTMLTPMYK